MFVRMRIYPASSVSMLLLQSLQPVVWLRCLQGPQKPFSLHWKEFRHCFKTTGIMISSQTLTRLSGHWNAMELEYYRGLMPILFHNGFSSVFFLAFKDPSKGTCPLQLLKTKLQIHYQRWFCVVL
jgi:hypothetical protein